MMAHPATGEEQLEMFATFAFTRARAESPFRPLDDLDAARVRLALDETHSPNGRTAAPPSERAVREPAPLLDDDVDVAAGDRTTAAELAAEIAEALGVRLCPGHGHHGPQVDYDEDASARCWKCGREIPEDAAA